MKIYLSFGIIKAKIVNKHAEFVVAWFFMKHNVWEASVNKLLAIKNKGSYLELDSLIVVCITE